MENAPLSRLSTLQGQINNCLKDIRKHLQELEETTRTTQSKRPDLKHPRFANLLQDSLDEEASP